MTRKRRVKPETVREAATMRRTRGHMWLDAAYRRIEGYCKARSWYPGLPKCVAGRLSMSTSEQYAVYVRDYLGREGELVLKVGNPCEVLDDVGRPYSLTAASFEEALTAQGLALRPKASKRQLALL